MPSSHPRDNETEAQEGRVPYSRLHNGRAGVRVQVLLSHSVALIVGTDV